MGRIILAYIAACASPALAGGISYVRRVAVLLAVALSVAGCGKSYSYKYRITVTIRDHGTLKSASGVVRVKEASGIGHGAAPPVLCGEATPIALANGRVLFALLNGLPYDSVSGQFPWRTSPTGVLLKRLGLPTQWSYEDDSGLRRLPDIRTKIALQSYELPEFATFNKASDPTTVQRVDPVNPQAALGNGVEFEEVILQPTDESVTRGRVLPLLPWLDSWGDAIDGTKWGEAVHGYYRIQFRRQC